MGNCQSCKSFGECSKPNGVPCLTPEQWKSLGVGEKPLEIEWPEDFFEGLAAIKHEVPDLPDDEDDDL